MRWFTLVVSAVFIAIGIWMIADGNRAGWWEVGFFGLCLTVAIFEPRLRIRPPPCEYQLLITEDEIACEHPKRKRESIRWTEVSRIWYVTTSEGPRRPDEWILLEGEQGGCSFPTEVSNIGSLWDELSQRFPDFDWKPIIEGGVTYARHLCWDRQRSASHVT